MMVANPDQWVDVFADAGAGDSSQFLSDVDLYCFHIEALKSDQEIENLISHIKDKGMKVGIAIKPKTPSSVLYQWISKIDMALVMVIHLFTMLMIDSGTRFRWTEMHHILLCKSSRSPRTISNNRYRSRWRYWAEYH